MLKRLFAFSLFMLASGCYEDCHEHVKLDVEKISACYYNDSGGYIVVAGEVGATDPYLAVMAHIDGPFADRFVESGSDSDGSFFITLDGSEDDTVNVYAYPACEDANQGGIGTRVLVSVGTNCE